MLKECDENRSCEEKDSECVDTEKKKNICIWLMTPKADDFTVPPDLTVPADLTTFITDFTFTTPVICDDQISNCEKYLFLCTNKLYRPLMSTLCQLTCGFCGSSTSTTEICRDMAAPGKPSDCPQHADLCNDANYKDLMAMECPKTCGCCNEAMTTTTSTICDDKKDLNGRSNCKDLQYLCNVSLYKPLISIQCPKTCGLC
uniref:ShKT domain-containing protein n=1 Tax=Setaria digitata TaxID=48799 RepID=A0A915PL63_9BILA